MQAMWIFICIFAHANRPTQPLDITGIFAMQLHEIKCPGKVDAGATSSDSVKSKKLIDKG